jgi:hypothetical protein
MDGDELAAAAPPDTGPDPSEQGWRQNKQGRWYVPRRGRPGTVIRRGNETPEEAHARDERDRDKETRKEPKPKKTSSVPKAPAPTKVTSVELEHMLSEALCAPAFGAGMRGEPWAANHFTKEGPTLARNLVAASEHNAWLRAKLEAWVMGEDILVKLLTLLPVASALIAYSVPPIIYYFDPPFFPAEARQLFAVPDRKEIIAERKRREQEENRAQAAQAAAAAEAAAATAGPVAAAA